MPIDEIQIMGRDFEDGIHLAHSQKQKFAKNFLNHAGMAVGVFIVFAVVVMVTTDVSFTSIEDFKSLGKDFFLLFFCTYSMYVSSSDSGMRKGMQNEIYLSAKDKFEEKKKHIIISKNQRRLHEFCRYYVDRELESAKMNILAVVGFDYEIYLNNWIMLSSKRIWKSPCLTKPQKKAILKANAVMPIKLTPEMILKRGRSGGKRSPLGMTPEMKKTINFGVKFASNIVIVLTLSAMIINYIIEPTWLMFASLIMRLLLVVLNAFSGYKFGYENIVFDTANYMSDQTDLMDQAIQYFEEMDSNLKASEDAV